MCIFISFFLCSVLIGVACVLWHPIFCACWCLTGQGSVWESPVYFAVFQCMCILASYFMCSWLFCVVCVFLNLFPVTCAVLRCMCTDILFAWLAEALQGKVECQNLLCSSLFGVACVISLPFSCVVACVFSLPFSSMVCCLVLHVYSHCHFPV